MEFEHEARDPVVIIGAGEQILGLQKDLELMTFKCAAAEIRALNTATELERVKHRLKDDVEIMTVKCLTAAMHAIDAETENEKLNMANISFLKSLLEKYEDMGADCKADMEKQIEEMESLLMSRLYSGEV
ncbi:hypothetical protein Tco_1457561 [Tanacetum coccineum]